MSNKIIKFGSSDIEIPENFILNNKKVKPLTKTNGISTRKGVKSINLKTNKNIDKPLIKHGGELIEITKKEKIIKPKKEKFSYVNKPITKKILDKLKSNNPIIKEKDDIIKKQKDDIYGREDKKYLDELNDNEEREKLNDMFKEIVNEKNPNNKYNLHYDNLNKEIIKIQKLDKSFKQKSKLLNDLYKMYVKKNKI